MPNINDIQNEIIEDFSLFDDWMEKYEYIIDMGKSLPLIDEKYKTDDYIIKGCQSKVWLKAEKEGDRVNFYADSDAVITKGIISMLIKVLSGQRPEEIANADLYFIEKIGLKEHLSPTRSNGLVSMIKQMKYYGLGMESKIVN
ncbi:MAG: SufE family protein [Saprospirales bacterium]|nr:MAG: SufE family protein [Saprospirales bacterium]